MINYFVDINDNNNILLALFLKKIENMLLYNKNDIEPFIIFLLHDLISENEIQRLNIKNDYQLISKIINNPESFFNKYFDEIYRIENINDNVKPIRILPLKHEVVGRSIICVRTCKITNCIRNYNIA